MRTTITLAPTLVSATLAMSLGAGHAHAQSFGLDDLPVAPIVGPPGFGFGAEDPYAFIGPPLAPSPSLGFLGGLGDGAWLSAGPVLQHPGPNGAYVDAFSSNHVDRGGEISLEFSVDRVSFGVPGTGVSNQVALGQAHADIFTGTHRYISPGVFAGGLGPGPFAGFLPAVVGGAPGNVLQIDESAFGLLTPFGVVPAGVAVPPPSQSPALHDNIDSYDSNTFDANNDVLFDIDAYFTLYPDEAAVTGLSPADIIAVAQGDTGAIPVPYASFAQMGLTPFEDSIDALVMYDNNLRPLPLSNPNAPGAVEPVRDYALFSLAPGSAALQIWGLDAADIFFTDFTGAFAVYAPSFTLGLNPTPPGIPFQGENIDALDIVPKCVFINPGFETGDFTGWITQDLLNPFFPLTVQPAGFAGPFLPPPLTPTEGNFAAVSGYDGDGALGPNPIFFAQDVTIPGNILAFDWRAGWSMGGTLPRTLDVVVRPLGGGAPLATFNVLTSPPNTTNPDTGWITSTIDLGAFSGVPVRVGFEMTIPETFTGPAEMQIDNVCLNCSVADLAVPYAYGQPAA